MFLDAPTSGSHSAYCILYQDQDVPTDASILTLPETVFFDSVSDDGRRFELSSKLTVSVSQEANMVILESNVLPIIAYGETLEQASDAFEEHFGYLWDSISDQPDDALTLDALDVKRAQRNLVSGIAASA